MQTFQETRDLATYNLPTDYNNNIYQQDNYYIDSNHQKKSNTADPRIYELNNFVGMTLEELRYSCETLKGDIQKDRLDMLQKFYQALQLLNQLAQKHESSNFKTQQTQMQISTPSHFLRQNEVLKNENLKLKDIISLADIQHRKQIQKINQESYRIFEENFVLNQKVVSLQQQLSARGFEVIEDLKRQHQISLSVLEHQILSLQEVLRQKQQNISFLEQMIKEHELNQGRRSARYQNRNSKILSMFPTDSYDYKQRNITSMRNDSFNNSSVRERRYDSRRNDSIQESDRGKNRQLPHLDTSTYRSVTSPATSYQPQLSGFGYHQNQLSAHTQSFHRINPSFEDGQYMNQFTNVTLPTYYGKRDPFLLSVQPSPRANQCISSRTKNQVSNQYFSSKGIPSIPIGIGKEERKQRRELMRQTSRQQRLQSVGDGKLDLAKIQNELEGLAKQLKSQLQTISRKK